LVARHELGYLARPPQVADSDGRLHRHVIRVGDLPACTWIAMVHAIDEVKTLESAVRAGVPYVGLVASRKRGEAVVASLDLDDAQRAAVHTPAGLDIGARTPRYWFCGTGCLRAFAADPGAYPAAPSA
jgi:xanthine/CO dehydrogenase XdhC/CoxF family maturation factor